MNFVLVSNKILENLNRTITKSNRTLVEDDNSLSWETFRDVDRNINNAVKDLTYSQLDKIMKDLGGYVNDFNGGAPYFIDRYGDIISVEDSYASSETGLDEIIHYDYAGVVFDELLKYPYKWQTYIDDKISEIEDRLLDKMLSLGVIRANTGTSDVEERCYCALPDKKDFVLNDSQYDALDKFFWWAKENKGDVQVYMGDAPTLYYSFDKEINTPDKLINRVKQYYNGFSVNEADQLSIDVDNAVASQVQKGIEEKEHQLESAMYYHYKDSIAGYNGADVKVSPDDTATIVTHWNVDDMLEELEYDVVKLFDQFEFRETQPHRVNDLKKTITFYISLGYGGSLDKEELKKEFLTLLAKNGTSDYTDRGFILPDGSLVGNEKFGKGGEPHYRVDDMITRKMAITNGVDEDEIIGAFGLKNNSRGLVADLCGCIRVNGWNEDYIALPPNKPTKQQLDTLEEWIDNFFEIRGFNDYLYVTDFYGNNQKEYHSPEYEGRDIVDKIVRFYNTGNLYEEKQDSEETKRDFVEGKQDCKIKTKILKGRK